MTISTTSPCLFPADKNEIYPVNKIALSIVSPVYRAESLVSSLVERLRNVLLPLGQEFEIILVDDASPDKSWESIKMACASYAEVTGVRLSRNFGQHYAISAGLMRAKGRRVVVMDCDLQDQPEEIPKLLAKADEGYDIVLARRSVRQDGWLKRLGSSAFYGVLAWLTGSRQDSAIANFGIYTDKVIAAINAMPESNRYFPTMVRWVGFKTAIVNVEHARREDGKTSYNVGKLFNLALDICLAYSDKPLRMVVGTGFVISLVGFLFAGYTLLRAWRGDIEVLGYASLIVSIWVLSGLIILIVGVVGLYVGKAFEGIKRRPAFIIDEILNNDTNG
jgi:glycosyltransferase involved in cell wall biosynthesis